MNLNLTRDEGMEWEHYKYGINHCGYELGVGDDKLMWSWNEALGEVIVKDAYDSIFFDNMVPQQKWWHRAVWALNVPLKINIFI